MGKGLSVGTSGACLVPMHTLSDSHKQSVHDSYLDVLDAKSEMLSSHGTKCRQNTINEFHIALRALRGSIEYRTGKKPYPYLSLRSGLPIEPSLMTVSAAEVMRVTRNANQPGGLDIQYEVPDEPLDFVYRGLLHRTFITTGFNVEPVNKTDVWLEGIVLDDVNQTEPATHTYVPLGNMIFLDHLTV